MEPLDHWIERQYRHAAGAMLRSVSAVGIVKKRPGFGQTVSPQKGSIVASPVLAPMIRSPDYFFHWFRDSAVVIDALRLLFEDGSCRRRALSHFAGFRALQPGAAAFWTDAAVAAPAWRSRVSPDFRQFVRPDADLAAAHGEALAAETRVNPDGTLDISRWARPQYDGPALRALALLRWVRSMRFDAELECRGSMLLRADLPLRAITGATPCFDIWEEEKGLHYYTLRVRLRRWSRAQFGWRHGARQRGAGAAAAPTAIGQQLDGYWLEDRVTTGRAYWKRQRSAKELDIAVIFAAIHAGGRTAPIPCRIPHACHAGKIGGVVRCRISDQPRRPPRGPAMGRYAGDVYYSGGAYYFSTLAAAEFCFRAALAHCRGAGADRARRCFSGNRARLHAAERRAVRTIRSAAPACRPPRSISLGATPHSSPASRPGARSFDVSSTSRSCARSAATSSLRRPAPLIAGARLPHAACRIMVASLDLPEKECPARPLIRKRSSAPPHPMLRRPPIPALCPSLA